MILRNSPVKLGDMKTFFKRLVLGLLTLIVAASLLIAIEYFGAQPMGLFSGSRPTDLGFKNGAFAKPSWKPNAVSSTIDKADETHYIAPIHFSGDAASSWSKLTAAVKAQTGARVIAEQADYLYAEFKSAGMGFVDDVEFALDAKAGVIHVRSASRLGVRDLGVNRRRVEILRSQIAAK